MYLRILALFLSLGFIHSCIKAPDISDVPTLEFIGFSKTIMNQGDLNNDSIFITLAFTDGDGDIGSALSFEGPNLFVIDNRNGETYDNIKIPQIPPEGAGNGVKGTIVLKIYNGCCLFDDRPNCTQSPDISNQLSFDITLVDRGGNESNTITTSEIELRCI